MEQRILKQDGYLELGTSMSGGNALSNRLHQSGEMDFEISSIIYHTHLNVVLIFDYNGAVKIIDIHTGITLQTYQLTNDKQCKLYGHFMPLQEKILITDGHNIGFRGDYNGVLLLDTILQSPLTQNDDMVRLEILLSEAVILQSCIKELEQEGLECPSDVSNELMEKIKNSQSSHKKGIKAQRWSTICLEVPYSSLKLLANNMVIMLKRLERHVPVLAIASAINERLTDLLAGSRIPDINWHCNNIQRILMHSEAVRRQTFEKWPHMDYKWALPDQMAQAGFYHQPSSSGEDRAMCFTCNVCLVCWEKTDEPWSEHERHSPMCPFVKGEYTQNVPLAVTYATNPAVKVPGSLGFDVISNSDYANVLCTSCSHTGDLIIWSIERHLKQMYCFNIQSLMKDIICNNTSENNDACNDTYEWVRVTAICVLPNAKAQSRLLTLHCSSTINSYGGNVSGVGVGRSMGKESKDAPASGTTQSTSSSARAGVVGSRVILGLSTLHTSGEYVLRLVVLNIVESERSSDTLCGLTSDTDGETQNIAVINNATAGSSGIDVGGEGALCDNRDDNISYTSLSYDKYTDNFDSANGITNDFIATASNKKSDTFTTISEGKSDLEPIKFFDLNSDKNLKQINQFCNLTLFELMGNTADTTVTTIISNGTINENIGIGGGSSSDVDIESAINDKQLMGNIINGNANYNQNNNKSYQSHKQMSKNNYSGNNTTSNKINNNNHHNSNNNNYENNGKDTNATNNNETSNNASKLTISDDIDCIVESCTTLKRMNALNVIDNDGEISCHRRQKELVQIAEIIPTNSHCNKLLVKLVKAKAPSNTCTNKIIMANIENENDFDNQTGIYENNEDDDNVEDISSVACQVLLFDYLDGFIPNEHKMAVTFSRVKFPRQICLLPNFIVSNNCTLNNDTLAVNQLDNTNGHLLNITDSGAFCAVCNDGTIEIYSLSDFKCVSVINEPDHHFVTVAYCSSLERLCCCTNSGSIIFYSLNDVDNDSGDEMLDLDEDNNTVNLMLQQQQNNLVNVYDKNSQNNTIELSVTDGVSGGGTSGGGPSQQNDIVRQQQQQQQSASHISNIKIDCGASFIHSNNVHVASTASNMQSSPSSSSSTGGASSTSTNLLAYRTGDLTLDDLHTLHALTQFEENLTVYGAEVPSCWSDLVQAQKQRKQPQSMRSEDLQFTKTWRLHNDTTTWDEHIIELNLLQAVNLGHIDLKFTLYQQCQNPAAIQVTLLKQNATSFGYRMKGHHTGYKHHILDDDTIHQNFLSMIDGNNENPVLNEEYLHTHNAEILAGPIELSSCMDLGEQSGTVTLTSPKLFKTRTRNFLLHIKTMADPSKEIPSKNRGCDWLHEISICVRGVRSQLRIPNERLQRIAMLESNQLIETLFKIVSTKQSTTLAKTLALDILIWICCIRLKRYRSPKSERIKMQINKQTAGSCPDLLAQQFECICLTEKYLENTLRECVIGGDRSIAHKCLKLIILLTDGICNLPSEIQAHTTLDVTMRDAIANTFNELPLAKYASAVYWYATLTWVTSTLKCYQGIPELCIKLLAEVSEQINKRSDPYCALLGTRFGLYGFPFEAEIFDFDLTNVNKNNVNFSSILTTIIRTSAGVFHAGGIDIKKLSSIDGVDLRTFPQLIRCKSVSNQLRGLLEVEQLHFTCICTSEATRIDNIDTISPNNASNVNVDDLVAAPMLSNEIDLSHTLDMNDFLNNVKNNMNKLVEKLKFDKAQVNKYEYSEAALKPNAIDAIVKDLEQSDPKYCDMSPLKINFMYEEQDNDQQQSSSSSTITGTIKTSTHNHNYHKKTHKKDILTGEHNNTEYKTSSETSRSPTNNVHNTGIFPWHKLLMPPSKQMIVIDRMHSGARRFVILDFGSPILLTDVFIPSCDDLASLHIDIWCFEENTDSVRLVVAPDIGAKTLVLSDLQPPPICRFLKITVTGRIGMSSTKCKIPIGSFFGHVIVLESDIYADPYAMLTTKYSSQNLQAQVKALTSLYEDVHCRYSLASCKLLELLTPILNSEISNIAHMQAFINRQRDDDCTILDNSKITSIYEECILLQHQIYTVQNVIKRLTSSSIQVKTTNAIETVQKSKEQALQTASRDKLRVLGQTLVEMLLNFSIEYNIKDLTTLHQHFTKDIANVLFNALVVHGDAYVQLATCSLLVRTCCFQSWWGDFLADIFCRLFSSQNTKIFPQDRIFFMLTYLGRRSIAMGTCRSIVIDAILKTLAKLLAPISPYYQELCKEDLQSMENDSKQAICGLWAKSDLQLISWLLLFLSICLDDNNDRKDKSANRWDFMSCDSEFSKPRTQTTTNNGKQLRCFKKRIVQQKAYGTQPYTEWGKKIYMIQNEHPGIFMELTGKPKLTNKSNKSSILPRLNKESIQEGGSNFDKGLKTIRLNNILMVIRGLIALLLEMDFTCNMDKFLLTCKVIARLVYACRPAVQLSKIITTNQLEQLIRLAVWNDQHQPWAVHAITCLLQDLLDADKHFKDNDLAHKMDGGVLSTDGNVSETKDIFSDYTSLYLPQSLSSSAAQTINNDVQYTDGVKYPYLPSLIECDDNEFDEILNDIDLTERKPSVTKKETAGNKNTYNFFCKSLSGAMDARLDTGLNLHVEMDLRRINIVSSLDMFSSLPQIMANDIITNTTEVTPWPDYITEIWSGPEYNCGLNTYNMFKNVFDCILADLHLQETWVHLEQVLQMWLTLNNELSDKSLNVGCNNSDMPKIPFGANAAQGLLLALAWHSDIKLRTWCLGFQCLVLACNSQPISDGDMVDTTRINEVIISDENFEKMLLRFLSGYGMSSPIITNRCVGPTICKHLHELLHWLHRKGETTDDVILGKRKLKDTLLHVVLQLIQPGGAISNQLGPIDAQGQLIRDLLTMPNDKADLNVSLNIIECVSFLVYNNISNGDKVQCQRTSDANNASNTFTSLFANVLPSDHSKHSTPISDNALIISLLKLCSSLIQTELPRQLSDVPIPEEEDDLNTNESQTDEIKAEQLNIEGHRIKSPCIADTVLRHFPTMKRLLGSLSHSCSNSFTLMTTTSSFYSITPTDSTVFLEEPHTIADAVFNMLITLCEKASSYRLVVAPICQYLETSSVHRNVLPRLHMSEPLLWYISKVLDVVPAVQIFAQLGGVQIICKNLITLNKSLINMQPGLISLIMQHITRDTKLKMVFQTSCNNNSKKNCTNQAQRHLKDGLINFAPFCAISVENDTAQSADILISNPVAPHRRPRTPAWSYMFYPNESHADLTITFPTAILLKEVQLQPHAPTLASCPSAVALEISRDIGMGPIPVGPPLSTTGMTCIRLKLVKPEVATSIVLRLYRPKDSSSIGLTQIAVLGNTIFGSNFLNVSNATNNNNSGASTSTPLNSSNMPLDQNIDDDLFAKTSVGWVRILSRCFTVATRVPADFKLAAEVIGATSTYPGFLEACCSLLNIMPMIPNSAIENLETVLLKLGGYNRDMCLSLIRILLWGTTPQVYTFTNESTCNLLYDLCTTKDPHTLDKVEVLLEWILKLKQTNSNNVIQCNNPQSGLIKCIASILWNVYTENQVTLSKQLQNYITNEIFDTCFAWTEYMENGEPLKVAFDSLICSLCYIKPILFERLLVKVGAKLPKDKVGANSCEIAETPTNADSHGVLTNNSNAEIMHNVWFENCAKNTLMKILQRPAYLLTIALACQSANAVIKLVDSGLPKLLAYALYEYCTAMMVNNESFKRNVQKHQMQGQRQDQKAENSAGMPIGLNSTNTDKKRNEKIEDENNKVKGESTEENSESTYSPPLLKSNMVSKILDFFSECCAEGYVRDWLGTQQGAIFWKPLLNMLCNRRSLELSDNFDINYRFECISEPIQQTFLKIERSTIEFFSRVTTCHPKNQDTLTTLLIDVIRKPPLIPPYFVKGNNECETAASTAGTAKVTISGFTRQLVLQLLLENERILISVRSKQPLQRRGSHFTTFGGHSNVPVITSTNFSANSSSTSSNGVSMSLVNHHPSKRASVHHLLFLVSTNSKCQDILRNCISDGIATLSSVATGGLLNNEVRKSMVSGANEKIQQQKYNDSFNELTINLNNIDNGMEFLSVAAGVTAKDKRAKDAKNQVAATGSSTPLTSSAVQKDAKKDLLSNFTKFVAFDDYILPSTPMSNTRNKVQLVHADYPNILITGDTTISQLLAALNIKGYSLSTPHITLHLVTKNKMNNEEDSINEMDGDDAQLKAVCVEPLLSPLQKFSRQGGLSLLAHYLPTVFPDNSNRKTPNTIQEKEKSPPMTDWVKLEPNDDIYEDLEDPLTDTNTKHMAVTITSVPQHSLAAFGLFLRLPAYSDVLLRDKLRAQCLLRLVLGVTGDGEGNDIYSLCLAPSLPTLPFEVFRQLLDSSPLTTDDGLQLRHMVIDVGAMHLLLNCLGVFTHQSSNYQLVIPQNEVISSGLKNPANSLEEPSLTTSDDKSHIYWAKGTGFGTGSTTQSWNVEQALLRQKSEEEHVTVLLQVLSSYINPGDRPPLLALLESKGEIVPSNVDSTKVTKAIPMANELPKQFAQLLKQSCLIPALSSYLRNDSVLDITRHIPLYRAVLQLLRALSVSQQLVPLLQPQYNKSSPSIAELLLNMKTCVDTYAKRLKVNKKSNIKGQTQQIIVTLDDGDDEGLALLIPDIQDTTYLVQQTTHKANIVADHLSISGCNNISGGDTLTQSQSIEERYLGVMKKLQFDTYDMIVEAENNGYRFTVSHHFEKMVRLAGDRYHPSRVKRLAQEAVTLSTSLPLSFSSSVFVRCDTDRLDVMKVLITGPADTPYANGCFEFDVFFPPDYPNQPMQINLETTGRHSVRFNPNLYNDGKVCLSVLNTWHGRPEEKWNAQTSSFLQVLVSIQSLILVPEPYFNEPGFERSRGTPSGTHSSREYNSNIFQACVRWAMLEQIRNPSPCFKEVIQKHFWLKRNEICAQIENWIEELGNPQYCERNTRTISFNAMVLRRQYRHLREELAKLKTPEGLEDLDSPFSPHVTFPTTSDNNVGITNTCTTSIASNNENSNINKIDNENNELNSNVSTTVVNVHSNTTNEISSDNNNVIIFNSCDNNDDKSNENDHNIKSDDNSIVMATSLINDTFDLNDDEDDEEYSVHLNVQTQPIDGVEIPIVNAACDVSEVLNEEEMYEFEEAVENSKLWW